jgi:hypothetical protein
LDEGDLHADIDCILEAIYLHLFGKEDELNSVDAHPRHARVEVL